MTIVSEMEKKGMMQNSTVFFCICTVLLSWWKESDQRRHILQDCKEVGASFEASLLWWPQSFDDGHSGFP